MYDDPSYVIHSGYPPLFGVFLMECQEHSVDMKYRRILITKMILNRMAILNKLPFEAQILPPKQGLRGLCILSPLRQRKRPRPIKDRPCLVAGVRLERATSRL